MLTDRNLQELLEFSPEHQVLSVYLNVDPTQGSADTYKLKLRSMLKEVDLPQDVQRLERYFDHEYDWSGRSVALFSCAAEGFFRAFPLAMPVRSRVRVSNRAHVKPLADLLDSFGGYGVAVVDQQGARLFHFHLGELQEQEGLVGEAVRRTKLGGGSQAAGRRGGVAGQTKHADEVAERNMREAAEFAARFFADKHIRRVLIGGTEANVAQFRGQLPKTWQSLVMGHFPVSMTASHAEVLDRAIEVAQQAERQREQRLVENMITAAAKGLDGVVRLEDTLGAVHEGRVQTLIVLEGFREPGYQCQGCGYLTLQTLGECPFCQSLFDRIPDAVELAVRRVMRDGGEVEVLHDHPELQEKGQIGAILRY
jgi:peptide chain release factor subunit 1